MSKKKEIDVWVSRELANNPSDECFYHVHLSEEVGVTVKAKLIIEIPEPKIEVTPSQIREAIWRIYDPYLQRKDLSEKILKLSEKILKELFGEDV